MGKQLLPMITVVLYLLTQQRFLFLPPSFQLCNIFAP
jgi:hypothetical protein